MKSTGQRIKQENSFGCTSVLMETLKDTKMHQNKIMSLVFPMKNEVKNLFYSHHTKTQTKY